MVSLFIFYVYVIPYYEYLKSMVGEVKSVILFASVCVCLLLKFKLHADLSCYVW